MKADLVRKYLAPSPAMSKGLMKTGIRSTRKDKTPSKNEVKETTVFDTSSEAPNL
jgi:hypothetical protein